MIENMLQCWDCEGTGGQDAMGFWDGERKGLPVGGAFSGWMYCNRCGGAGRVREITREWARIGREIRERRLAREESQREAAVRLGFKRLSDYVEMEAGKIDPSPLRAMEQD